MAGVFISYRRTDSAGHAGRLADALTEGLEEQQLFRDIEAIEAGEDFVDALNRAVAACSVMLVVIGPTWARATTADGKRRLHQPDDFVRLEIETALSGTVRVIPVLVGDAQMPQAEDLPESMLPLLRRNAYIISDRRWQYDVGQLLDILEKIPGVARRSHKESGEPMPVAVSPQAPPPVTSPSPSSTSSPGHASSTVAPSASKGMPTWIKAAIAVVVILVVLAVIGFMIDEDDQASGPATASSAAAGAGNADASALPVDSLAGGAAHPQHFAGSWRSDADDVYLIEEAEGKMLVISGDAFDPAKTPNLPPPDAPPTRANFELVGEGVIDGASLRVTLTDRFSGITETLILSASGDGQSLVGTAQTGDDQPGRIVLKRQ